MHKDKGNLQQYSFTEYLSIPLFSYDNAFKEGAGSLHPGFWAGKLFALSSKSQKKNGLKISGKQVLSEHLKTNVWSYIIPAPNQDASVYNTIPAGTLFLTREQIKKLPLSQEDIHKFFHFNHNIMFKQVKGNLIFCGTAEQAISIFGSEEAAATAFNLPAKVFASDNKTTLDDLSSRFATTLAWTEDYAEGNTEPYKDVVEHIDADQGFLHGSQQAFDNLCNQFAVEIIAKYGSKAVDSEMSEQDATEYVAGLIQADTTLTTMNLLLGGLQANAAAIEETLGLTIEPATAEQIAAALENAQENATAVAVPPVVDENSEPVTGVEVENPDLTPAKIETPATPAIIPAGAALVPKTALVAAAGMASAMSELSANMSTFLNSMAAGTEQPVEEVPAEEAQ